MIDETRPLHQPAAPDAPIPGGPYWYACCDPDGAYVGSDGVCEGCRGHGCPVCGREDCPDCEVVRYDRSGGHVNWIGANVHTGRVVKRDTDWHPYGPAIDVTRTLLKVQDLDDLDRSTWVEETRTAPFTPNEGGSPCSQ